MYEILSLLQTGEWVLDLGCRGGSFPAGATAGRVIRFDLEADRAPGMVQGDARNLPFRDGCFRAIIANHSLEHLEDLELCLDEMARVLVAGRGLLYVAIPDSSTLSDRVYRWVSHGGGHINAIDDEVVFGARIARHVSLPLVATRPLHSSFAFLNRNGPVTWSRRVHLLGGGHEWSLRLINRILRWLDRTLKTRLSMYGWAFYLGELEAPDETPRANVCLRCGSAHVAAWLMATGRVRRSLLGRCFLCPDCGADNPFADD